MASADELLTQHWDNQKVLFFEWVHALVQRSVAEHHIGPQPPLEITPMLPVAPIAVPIAVPIPIPPAKELAADVKRHSQTLLVLIVMVAAEGLGIGFLVVMALR